MNRRVAFVSGASRGIGAESAVALARAGFDVAITARTLDAGEAYDQGGLGFGYPASKAALQRMAGALRVEHPESGLRILNIEPGLVVTELKR